MKTGDHWDDDEIDDCITASDPDLFPPTERIDVWPRSHEPAKPGAEQTMMRSFFDPTPPDSVPRWVAPTPRPVSPWAPHARATKPVFPKPPTPLEPPPPESSSVPKIVPPSPTIPRRRVELVWFDADSMEGETNDAMKVKLESGDAREDAIAHALDSDERVLVLSGELRFPFDEIARLRALVVGAAPLVRGDDELERIVGAAKELLDTEWVSACTAAQLADAIQTALRHRKRKSPSLGALEGGVERVLLRERRYQRRTVFGGASLRTLFGRSGTPAYIPEAAAAVLPMFHVLEVTMIAEVNLSQDQYETSPHALRVLALGRAGKP